MIEIGENLKDVLIAVIPALFGYLAGKYTERLRKEKQVK